MRVISSRIGGLANIAISVLIAMGLSMIVRPVTATLNETLGTVWPFSTVHCDSRTSPGCEPNQVLPAGRVGFAER